MFEQWIRIQSDKIKLEVYNRFSHFLSDREIITIMEAINNGRDITDIHIELGLFEKYRVELFKIQQIVTEAYPEEVID